MQPYRPVLLIIFLLLFSAVAVALDVPQLRGRVNDYANVLQTSQAQALEAQLAQLERDTGHQV
ncbi:MAG: TPM domain-containing protein, partial [Candidatus Binatia bacterium]